MSESLDDYVGRLYSDPKMLEMGHRQRQEDLNLGLGWIYYGLGRLLRPANAVVIGSYRGFAPSVIAKALLDNSEEGLVTFIDPSLVDDFWSDPASVEEHFSHLGTSNVHHWRYTTQAFIETDMYADLSDISLLMVDGYHSAEQARFDYLAFFDKLTDEAVVLFHDSVERRMSRIYDRDNPYEHTVCVFMDRLKHTPGLEVFTLPFDSGVSLVRGRPETLAFINEPLEA